MLHHLINYDIIMTLNFFNTIESTFLKEKNYQHICLKWPGKDRVEKMWTVYFSIVVNIDNSWVWNVLMFQLHRVKPLRQRSLKKHQWVPLPYGKNDFPTFDNWIKEGHGFSWYNELVQPILCYPDAFVRLICPHLLHVFFFLFLYTNFHNIDLSFVCFFYF